MTELLELLMRANVSTATARYLLEMQIQRENTKYAHRALNECIQVGLGVGRDDLIQIYIKCLRIVLIE